MKKSAQVHKGFTLVELLVVIAIIAILAAVVVLIINPLELTRRGRDAARLSDLANLQSAINVAVQEATVSGGEVLCNGGATPCNGSSNGTGATNRSSDGTGWVPVNLAGQSGVSVPVFPVDPVNSGCVNSQNCHYTYCSNGETWEISTTLESQQQASKATGDGGNDTALYEIGTNLNLIAATGGSCTY